MARSYESNFFTITQQLRLAYFKVLVFRSKVRHWLAAETDIDGSLALEDGLLGGNLSLSGIAW